MSAAIMDYIHQQPAWPHFHWSHEALAEPLAAARHTQGRLAGRLESLGFAARDEALLRTLTADVLKTSEIEGERLDSDQVRSSVARRLGLDIGGLTPADRQVEGMVEMTLDATRNFAAPLTEERLFAWHAALFPTGRSGMTRVAVGAWRDDRSAPMQVVSGPVGRERVHFEAPAAARVRHEMASFLAWINGNVTTDPLLVAAQAHLWFITIHPFDDGNGRIARAIADLALARSERSSQRVYSMSAQIQQERSAYYGILERTQHGTLDITNWMQWFLGCLTRAVESAHVTFDGMAATSRAWDSLRAVSLNDRQRLIVTRLLDGFAGALTTSKWAALAKCSQDTALRDILQLVERGVLVRNVGGGRSTSYALGPIGDRRPQTPA